MTPVRSVRADVMMAPLVKGQVAVIMLQVMSLLVLEVVVKVFVVEVGLDEVLLFSLSSTPTPRTRPAARCLGLGRSGSRLPDGAPCTRPALFWTFFLEHGSRLS